MNRNAALPKDLLVEVLRHTDLETVLRYASVDRTGKNVSRIAHAELMSSVLEAVEPLERLADTYLDARAEKERAQKAELEAFDNMMAALEGRYQDQHLDEVSLRGFLPFSDLIGRLYHHVVTGARSNRRSSSSSSRNDLEFQVRVLEAVADLHGHPIVVDGKFSLTSVILGMARKSNADPETFDRLVREYIERHVPEKQEEFDAVFAPRMDLYHAYVRGFNSRIHEANAYRTVTDTVCWEWYPHMARIARDVLGRVRGVLAAMTEHQKAWSEHRTALRAMLKARRAVDQQLQTATSTTKRLLGETHTVTRWLRYKSFDDVSSTNPYRLYSLKTGGNYRRHP